MNREEKYDIDIKKKTDVHLFLINILLWVNI